MAKAFIKTNRLSQFVAWVVLSLAVACAKPVAAILLSPDGRIVNPAIRISLWLVASVLAIFGLLLLSGRLLLRGRELILLPVSLALSVTCLLAGDMLLAFRKLVGQLRLTHLERLADVDASGNQSPP